MLLKSCLGKRGEDSRSRCFPPLHSGVAKQEIKTLHSLLPNFLWFAKDYFNYRNFAAVAISWREVKRWKLRLGYRLREPSRSCEYKRMSQSPRSLGRLGGKAAGWFIFFKEGCCWGPKHLHRKNPNIYHTYHWLPSWVSRTNDTPALSITYLKPLLLQTNSVVNPSADPAFSPLCLQLPS